MKKILAGNWKMHKTRSDVRDFIEALIQDESFTSKSNDTEVIVCPSPTLLEAAADSAAGHGLKVYAQNVAFEDSGAYTGEVSPLQLMELGVSGTLVGHSERRSLFGDTDETCAKRAAKAFEHGLGVIYCIGESLEQREAGQTKQVVTQQLNAVADVLQANKNSEAFSKSAIAYEPVWAIGTGKVATTEQIQETHAWIEAFLKEVGAELPILYGGSVKPNNFSEISSLESVSGGLVGGASLKSEDFSQLLQILS